MVFAKQNPKIPEHINATKEHPLKEFGILVLGIGIITLISATILIVAVQNFSQYIPFEYEMKLGDGYKEAFEEQYSNSDKSFDDSQFLEAQKAITALGNDLVTYADLPEDMTLQFHLINAPELPNAFATLGGHVFVTTGLLKEVSSENALAFVIAHEIAHVKHRHVIQGLSSGVTLQLLLSLVIGGDGYLAQSVLSQTVHMTMLGFSREMELEADQTGALVTEQKYGHLNYATEFFQKIRTLQESPKWLTFFQTHPDLDKRIEQFADYSTTKPSAATKAVPLDTRLVDLVSSLIEDGGK